METNNLSPRKIVSMIETRERKLAECRAKSTELQAEISDLKDALAEAQMDELRTVIAQKCIRKNQMQPKEIQEFLSLAIDVKSGKIDLMDGAQIVMLMQGIFNGKKAEMTLQSPKKPPTDKEVVAAAFPAADEDFEGNNAPITEKISAEISEIGAEISEENAK